MGKIENIIMALIGGLFFMCIGLIMSLAFPQVEYSANLLSAIINVSILSILIALYLVRIRKGESSGAGIEIGKYGIVIVLLMLLLWGYILFIAGFSYLIGLTTLSAIISSIAIYAILNVESLEEYKSITNLRVGFLGNTLGLVSALLIILLFTGVIALTSYTPVHLIIDPKSIDETIALDNNSKEIVKTISIRNIGADVNIESINITGAMMGEIAQNVSSDTSKLMNINAKLNLTAYEESDDNDTKNNSIAINKRINGSQNNISLINHMLAEVRLGINESKLNESELNKNILGIEYGINEFNKADSTDKIKNLNGTIEKISDIDKKIKVISDNITNINIVSVSLDKSKKTILSGNSEFLPICIYVPAQKVEGECRGSIMINGTADTSGRIFNESIPITIKLTEKEKADTNASGNESK